MVRPSSTFCWANGYACWRGTGQWLASIYLDLLRLLAVLLAALLAARFVDHRPLADWGFHFNRRWWLDLLFGMVLGTVLMGAFLPSNGCLAGWR